MKKYILLPVAALMLSVGLFAQSQDSLLQRQMELERDFNPTLMDANKINSLPTLREPVVQKANTNYSNWAGRTSPPLEIAIPRPGTVMTNIPFSTQKGYVSLAGGSYANIDGVFGYRIMDDEKNRLSFNFLHNSTNGKLKYNQAGGERDNKAKAMDNAGELNYGHNFSGFSLDSKLSYLHSSYNYYGNTFETERLYNNENQTYGLLNVHLGVTSKENRLIEYKGYVDFKNFSTKFGESLMEDGLKGSQLNAMVDLSKPFGSSDNRVGVEGKLLSTYYNDKRKDYMLVNAAPYLGVSGLGWDARFGADVLFHILGKTQVRVVPNVDIKWNVTDHSSLYAKVHGGYESNTFIEMMRESRYVFPGVNVTPSFSILDIEVGTKIGELSGFRFDIFAGFKQTDDEHFLVLGSNRDNDNAMLFDTFEYLTPYYANISHSHIGGAIQTNIWSPLEASLRLKKNFYNMKDDDYAMAYNKPGFEADLRATFTATEQLKFSLNYYFANDRHTFYDNSNIKMDNINDLGLGAVYQISDAFSVNLQANNLLFQQYDIWYGHPAQSFNMMGGFSFRF